MSTSILPTPPDPYATLPWPRSQMNMFFTRDGFCGYTPASQPKSPSGTAPQAMWWSSIPRASPATRDADIDEAGMRAELLRRHRGWADATMARILETNKVDVRVATWVTPKLRAWHGFGGRVVLVGDAAHAMPSSNGQGVSQALEDTLTVALLVRHHLGIVYGNSVGSDGKGPSEVGVKAAEGRGLEKAWSQYEMVRKGHVEAMVEYAVKQGDTRQSKGLLEMCRLYVFLWVLFTVYGSQMRKALWEYKIWNEVDRVIRKDEPAKQNFKD